MVQAKQWGLNPAWIIVAAGVSAALHVGKLPPAIPILQQALGVSLLQAGFLLSTVQVAGMTLGLVVGLGADRLGLRRSMLCGLALMALSSLMGAAASDFGWLLALRALEGMGFLLVAMPGPGLIRRLVPPNELSGRMGWWTTYMPLGSALGLLLGPWVLQASSWQTWWLLLGGVSLLATAAIWRFVPADPQRFATDKSLGEAQIDVNSGWRPRLALTLRNPAPWLVAFSFAVYSGQWMGVIGFLPTIYAQAGLSAKLAGMLTALVAAANMVGNVASGKLLQRGWPVQRSLRTGFVTMSICALLAFVQIDGQVFAPLWVRFMAVVTLSAVGGLIPGTLFISAVHLAPSQQTVSTTVGLMQQCSSVGLFAVPPLMAAVATAVGGWQWTWAVTGIFCFIGWMLAGQVQRRWNVAHARGSSA